MKRSAFTAMLMTVALLAASGAGAQQYSYGYDARHHGGVSTISVPDGRGSLSSRTIIHGPAPGSVVIMHPDGALTTGTVGRFGGWYTITTPGSAYRYPRPLR